MYISFNLELDSYINQKGEKLIMIRCSQLRHHKRINTGVHVLPKQWDNHKKKIKKNHPLAYELNKTINKHLLKLTEKYTLLNQVEENVTLAELLVSLEKPKSITFYDFALQYKLSAFKNNRKLGTYRRYEIVLNKLREFAGKHLAVKQVDYALLKNFENYLLEVKKNGRDTVSSNLSVIRSIINEAIKHGLFDQRNPFDSLTLKYTNNTKHKLNVDELRKFNNVVLPDIPSLHLARDFFMACFYAGGCRGGDMLLMQWEYVKHGTIIYTQQKTGVKTNLPALPELMQIFEKYRSNSSYVFPCLQKEKEVNETILNSKLTYINKYLKEVCKYAGIFKKITTHCARHTFADISLDINNNDIYGLKDVLGHASVRTTELYLRERNYSKSNAYMEAIKQLLF